jgi:anthranilate phosphoribosyltransferase
MNEQSQVDANKVIESLLRQVAEYAQKVALLEAMLAKKEVGEENGD